MYKLSRPASVPEERLSEIVVYEYADLEKLQSIVQYGYEINDLIKRKGKPDLINDLITIDIESTTIRAGQLWNESEYPLAFPYTCQIYIFGSCWILRYDHVFLDFINALEQYLSDLGVTLVC